MKINKLYCILLSVVLSMQGAATVFADEQTIVIPGEQTYVETFNAASGFAVNSAYSISDGVLRFDRRGALDNIQAVAGAEHSDVIAEFDMKLTGASGATNNSVFFALRAASIGGPSLRFAYHDITKFDPVNNVFGSTRNRDRISVGYSSSSDDMTEWSIAKMSDVVGIEDQSAKSFTDFYTFRTAIIGENAFYQVLSGGEAVSEITVGIGGYTLPEKGKMFIGSQSCAAQIDEIRMYNPIEVADISIEAENMELTEGESTSFNVRVCDKEGEWHSLDKSRNGDFTYSYDKSKLSVDAENGTISALSADGLEIEITGSDFYTGVTKTGKFKFESITDEAAVSAAKETLKIGKTEIDSDFELPVEGLYNTEITWSSDSQTIKISDGKVTVIPPSADTAVQLTAHISRNGVEDTKVFDVTVKSLTRPERDIILKGELLYSENFDDVLAVDPDIKSSIDNEKVKLDGGALYINSKGVVHSLLPFGPEVTSGIAELDINQLSCTANTAAQLALGLFATEAKSFMYAYADICAYNPVTKKLDGASSRDRMLLGFIGGSKEMSAWTYYGSGKSPIGILNTSKRCFDKYYRFSAAGAGNTMLMTAWDDENVLDKAEYSGKDLSFGTGRLSMGMQNTEFLVDNIKLYDAIGFKSLEIKTDKSVIVPNTDAAFKIYADGRELDKKWWSKLRTECEDGVEVDLEKGTLKASKDGEFVVRIVADDYADDAISVKGTNVITSSSSADKLAEIVDGLLVSDYIDYPERIVKNFELPTELSDAKIEWASDSDAIEIHGGNAIVSRKSENTKVELTATIILNGVKAKKSFKVIVEQSYTDSETIAMDKEMIEIPKSTKSNLTLPNEGRYGSEIVWSSDDETIISKSGKVSRPKNNTMVKLTATFKSGAEILKQYYNVVVEGTDNTSGGGSGGGSSSSKNKASGMSVTTAYTPAEKVENNNERFAFKDIKDNFWAKDAIYKLVDKGVISKDSYFRPDDTITREEFTKLIVEAFDLYDEGAQCEFNDTYSDKWYYRYVASAYKAGIISGISDIDFGIGMNITRQDMAVIIMRMLEKQSDLPDISETTFEDNNEIAEYAKEAVAKLAELGIISGMGDNMFCPYSFATRAQAVVVIERIMK